MSADDARKLFVGGLGDSVSDVELRTFFETAEVGVEHIALPRDRETGRLRGFGFVTLTSEAEVPTAIAKLNGRMIGGRSLSVRPFSQDGPKRGAERPARAPEASLFVGKLPYDATEAELTALFENAGAGPVLRVTLPAGPDGRPRGFGFVTLASDDASNIALDKLNGASVRGRPIVISKAQPKGKPGERPAGGGSYSGGGGAPGGGFAQDERGFAPRPRRDEGPMGGSFSDSLPPPPPEGDFRGRAVSKDKRGAAAKKGAGPAGGDRGRGGGPGAGGDRGGRGGKGPRGGGGNWHRWEDDD